MFTYRYIYIYIHTYTYIYMSTYVLWPLWNYYVYTKFAQIYMYACVVSIYICMYVYICISIYIYGNECLHPTAPMQRVCLHQLRTPVMHVCSVILCRRKQGCRGDSLRANKIGRASCRERV